MKYSGLLVLTLVAIPSTPSTFAQFHFADPESEAFDPRTLNLTAEESSSRPGPCNPIVS